MLAAIGSLNSTVRSLGVDKSKALIQGNNNIVAFSGIPSDLYDRNRWIDPHTYNILFRLPKAELHLHQGGSADLSYLKYSLFYAIKNKQEHIQKILIKGEGREKGKPVPKEINLQALIGKSDKEILAGLNFIILRDLLRFRSKDVNAGINPDLISKLGRNSEENQKKISQYKKNNKNLLDEYRRISSIINPFVKNTPAAYYLASLYANEAMEEHTRYAEYRISPLGRHDLDKHKRSFVGSDIEDVISAVQAGFDDANLRVAKSGRKLDYGIIMLMERNPKSADNVIKEAIFYDEPENQEEKDTHLKYVQSQILSILQDQQSLEDIRSLSSKELGSLVKSLKENVLFETVKKNIEEKALNDAKANALNVAEHAIKLKKIMVPDPNPKAKKGAKVNKYNIVGIDLAGGEISSSVGHFEEAFKAIRDYNETAPKEQRLGITIHAGETSTSENLTGVESIEKAVDLAWSPKTPVRIGQALEIVNSSDLLKIYYGKFKRGELETLPLDVRKRIINSSSLLQKVIQRNIHLEYCPKSNVQTQAVESHDYHPALFLHRLGLGLKLHKGELIQNAENPNESALSISISTDNRTISNSDITNEWVKLLKHHQMTYDEVKQLTLNSFKSAFCDSATKKKLLGKVLDEFWDIEHSQKYYKGLYKLKRGQWKKTKDNPSGDDQIHALARSTAEIFLRESYRLGVKYEQAIRNFITEANALTMSKLGDTTLPHVKRKDQSKTIQQVQAQLN